MEKAVGLELSNISFSYRPYNRSSWIYECFVEVNGKRNDGFKIFAALYGSNGTIVGSEHSGINSFNGYAVVTVMLFDVKTPAVNKHLTNIFNE